MSAKTALTVGTAEYSGTHRQGSPEWHAARAAGIGSSDIASVLGIGYKSAFTLWHEKVGLIEPTLPDEKLQNKFDYGHHMEPFVASRFQKKHTELFVQETGSWRNAERPWQLSNPDRLVSLADSPAETMTAHSVVELKTFPSLADWDDGPALGYVAQLFWQLDTFGFRHGWIAGYANLSGDFVEYGFELNPFEADATRAVAEAFWLSVLEARQVLADAAAAGDLEHPGVRAILQELAPEIDGSDGTYQTLRRLNPSLAKVGDPNYEVDIPDEVAESYLAACSQFKNSESELFKWRGHLLAHMGTAKYAKYNDQRIASRVPKGDNPPYLKEA